MAGDDITIQQFSPAESDLTYCSWLDGIPNMRVLPPGSVSYQDTKCNPILSGKGFGFVISPENSRLNDDILRIAHPDSKTHHVSVGPVLATFPNLSDTHPSAAAADGWIWVFITGKAPSVLRFSSTTGVLEQRISLPSIERPMIAANDDGLFVARSNQGGDTGGVYFISIGSSHAQLVQATTNFTFIMQGTAHSMTLGEAPLPSGPYVEYRFVAVK